ncbi:RNA helicase [Bifidobacterium parmae]|uniref:RNA helicase n=1 Tax=Bifidobacterium parmae TaxID=361854 RepID=A0A2N5J4S9_9BIFI|nr:RNA helicase [Bifidobacterium parmae]
MRLCGWRKENTPQNVGGYLLDKETGTMPIFVKYAASQYEDEFLNAQEMRYYSKNGRTPQSPEFRWVREGADAGLAEWQRTHFVPLFVMRKAEEADGRYYYVGHVAAFDRPTLTTKPTASGEGRVNVTLSTLRLAKPLDPELYRHLTS